MSDSIVVTSQNNPPDIQNFILDSLKGVLKSNPFNSTKSAQNYISYFSLLQRFIYISSGRHRLSSL